MRRSRLRDWGARSVSRLPVLHTGGQGFKSITAHCLQECSKSWQTTCRMIAVQWTGFERSSPFMLTHMTCRYKMPNWQQVIEVERLGGPCAGNREASCMNRNREFRSLCGST